MTNYYNLYSNLADLTYERKAPRKVTKQLKTVDPGTLPVGQVLGLTRNVRDVVTPKRHCLKCDNTYYEDASIKFAVAQVCPYCGHVWYE